MWPNSALSTSVLLLMAGFLSSHIFLFFSSSVIAQSACPGRIRLDDAVRYENKRGIDIWYKSKLCLRYGGSLCLAKLERIKIPLQTCTPLIWQYVNISIPYTNALMRYFSITLDSHLARSDRVSACVSPLSWVGHIVKVHFFFLPLTQRICIFVIFYTSVSSLVTQNAETSFKYHSLSSYNFTLINQNAHNI